MQPLLPPCHHPSFAQWQAFRSHHLVAPAALPITSAPPQPTHRAKPEGSGPSVGPDWVAVVSHVGVPPELGAVMKGVEESLGRLFRQGRVVAYHGRMPFGKSE